MSYFISFERCQSSCEEHGTSEQYKNLVHVRIRTTDPTRPQYYKSTIVTIWPQLAWYEKELNVHEIYIYTIYK